MATERDKLVEVATQLGVVGIMHLDDEALKDAVEKAKGDGGSGKKDTAQILKDPKKDTAQILKDQLAKNGKVPTKRVEPVKPKVDVKVGPKPGREAGEKAKVAKVEVPETPKTCCVCGNPILGKQSSRTLPPDAEHKEKRFYHLATCAPGSKAWKLFAGKKSILPESMKDGKLKKEEKDKVRKEAAEKKAAVKKEAKEKKVAKVAAEVNKFNHRIGSMTAKIDDLFLKGTTMEEFEKKGIPKARVTWHAYHWGWKHKDEGEVVVTDGLYKLKLKAKK